VNLARTVYRQEHLGSATRYLEESLSISRQLDIRWSLAFSLEILGLVQRSLGNYERAYALFQESLDLSLQQENQQGIANCLGAIAGLASMTGQPTRSARLFAAVDKLRQTMGMRMGKDDQHEYEECLSQLRDQMDEATFRALWSEGSAMGIEQVVHELVSFGKDET
jgi:tetratricopeptide (TPR) repeat protein